MASESRLGGRSPVLQEEGGWPGLGLAVEGCRAVFSGQGVGLGRSRHFLQVLEPSWEGGWGFQTPGREGCSLGSNPEG